MRDEGALYLRINSLLRGLHTDLETPDRYRYGISVSGHSRLMTLLHSHIDAAAELEYT